MLVGFSSVPQGLQSRSRQVSIAAPAALDVHPWSAPESECRFDRSSRDPVLIGRSRVTIPRPKPGAHKNQ
jgi:hypothetical protein